MQTPPLIIGHRGACGYLPEHTLESYQRAIDLGTDCLETDVVMTRDGHLVCRHDCELSLTTNVADHGEFKDRRTAKVIDGERYEGWFIGDFTLAEIKTLRARERFDFRDHSNDDQFAIATLADLLTLAARTRTTRGERPPVLIEIKHAAYFESIGLPMDDAIADTLRHFSLSRHDAPAYVESFEINILRRLRQRLETPIIQLLDAPTKSPPDRLALGDPVTYAQMITPAGLAKIATYAAGIGVWKRLIFPSIPDPQNPAITRLAPISTLIPDARAAGLFLHAWTFRNEPQFLAADYQNNPAAEYRQFIDAGIDGIITDFPDAAHEAIAAV